MNSWCLAGYSCASLFPARDLTYRLDQFGLGRHVLRFELPGFLSDGLKPAVVAMTAADDQLQIETLEGFRVYGIGMDHAQSGLWLSIS